MRSAFFTSLLVPVLNIIAWFWVKLLKGHYNPSSGEQPIYLSCYRPAAHKAIDCFTADRQANVGVALLSI